MVFSSLKFLYLFMPIFFGIYYAVPARFKNGILLMGSLCFYAIGTWASPEHFLIFIVSMAVDYLAAILMERSPRHKKLFLGLGIVFHILCLGFFKYFTFFVDELSAAFPNAGIALPFEILLPIGISFYTFQGISYIADVYRGTVPAEKNAVRFFVYLSMFEQLIAGPIVTYPEIREDLRSRRIDRATVSSGFGCFTFGLGLKVLLANPIGKLWFDVNTIGFESISTPLAWMGIAAFSFQIFFDFYGYSLMAIGLGRMLGFTLPTNFDFPYLSRSMTEFWRRWHITLGSWFREYVYIPLGGNRKGTITTIRNLLIVWLLTGIWHGAGYSFMLWGGIVFAIITLEKYVYGKALNRHPAMGHLYMALIIPLTWAVFAIDSMPQMGIFFSRLFPLFGQSPWSSFRYDYVKYWNLYYPFFIAALIMITRFPYRMLEKIHSKAVLWVIRLAILGFCTYFLRRGLNDPFLYFRF